VLRVRYSDAGIAISPLTGVHDHSADLISTYF